MTTAKETVEVLRASKAKRLLEVIRANGCDALDLRDAAHEAHHALFTRLKPKWTRDRIHEALVKLAGRDRTSRSTLVAYELDARAVEWLVCDRYGIEYDAPKWADTMWWETTKNMNITLPSDAWILEAMKIRTQLPSIAKHVDNVIALAKPDLQQLSPDELKNAADPAPRCVHCGKPKKGHRYRHPFKAVL